MLSDTQIGLSPYRKEQNTGYSHRTFDIPIIFFILLKIYRNTNSMNYSALTPYESIASLGAITTTEPSCNHAGRLLLVTSQKPPLWKTIKYQA